MPAKMFVPALAALVTLAAATTRVQTADAQTAHSSGAHTGITKAIAVLHPTSIGGEASGTVTFTQTDHGIRVSADIRGLKPGPHGFHIHEYGDCSAPDAMSAGGHFNPRGMQHGDRTATQRHVGDLGNIEADEQGHAQLEIDDPALSFSGPSSILGRGLIVHEKADDLKSQPSGNAGGRVACGVIGVANPGQAASTTAPAKSK